MVQIIKILLDLLAQLCTGIIDAGAECIQSLFTKDRKTEYDATFIEPTEELSSNEKGFCVTGTLCMPIKTSYMNMIVYGSSGNFKSSGILIPSIYKMRGYSSLVITDFSGELLQKTSGALVAEGYDIKVVKWGSPEVSEGYNPFSRANNFSDSQKINKMLITSELGNASKDPFWQLAAEGVCNFVARYLLAYAPKEQRTLHNMYRLVSALNSNPSAVDKLMVKTHDDLIAEYKSIICYGSKVLSSIIAVCRAALSIFGTDPEVALVTSHDTLDVSKIRHVKTAIFLQTNTVDQRYYSTLTSIFLTQCFAEIMSVLPDEKMLPVFFLIDEASTLYFPDLQIILSNIRKYNAGILQVYQSPSQPIDLYNASISKALNENSYCKVFMPNQNISVAQEIQQMLGQFEYRDEKDIRHVRPLMTADEVRVADESIIFLGNRRAIKTRITPFFEQRKLLKLSELPPYVPVNKLPFNKPPTLQI